MSAKKWFLMFMVITCGVFSSVALFTYGVNPYGLFRHDGLSNLREQKIWEPEYALKAREIVWQKPAALFLGTSRTRIGLDPAMYKSLTGEHAYNAGVSGSNFHEQYAYFLHALDMNPNVKSVIVGLDMGNFSVYNENKPVFSEGRLQRTSWPLEDIGLYVLSHQALKDSAKVALDYAFQQNRYTIERPFLSNGLHNEAVLLSQHQSLQKDNPDYYLEWMAGQVDDGYGNYELSRGYVEEFKEMVRLCEENNIDLLVFFSPIHAIQLEGKYQSGLTDDYAEWKQTILSIVPHAWDFMGYNTITTKPVSDFGYYFDLSHYRKNVGDLILTRMLAEDDSSVPADFGVRVTADTVDEQMERIEEERRIWRERNPGVVADVEEALAEKRDQ